LQSLARHGPMLQRFSWFQLLVLLVSLMTPGSAVLAAQAVKQWKEWKGDSTGQGKASDGDKWAAGVPPGHSDSVRIAGGRVTLDVPLTVAELEFTGGTIDGSGSLLLSLTSGTSTWTGGEISSTTVTANTALTIGAGHAKGLNAGAILNLAGTTTWMADTLNTGGGASINNSGTFLAGAGGKIAHTGGTRATFRNTGVFTQSTAAAGTTEIEAFFKNTGSVNVTSGKLLLSGGAQNSANALIHVSANAQLEIARDMSLEAGSELRGAGLARLVDGVLTANGTIDIHRFVFAGGALRGTPTFTGLVQWTGGDWNATGPGMTTFIAESGVLELRNAHHDFNFRSIVSHGTVNWHAGNLRAGNGSVFLNAGIFYDFTSASHAIQSPGAFGGSFTFSNDGLYEKSGAGTTTVAVAFVNNGALLLAAGEMVFSGTYSGIGQIHLRNGASAQFAGPLIVPASAPLTGTGTIKAPSVTAAGTVSPGVSPGVLTIQSDLTLLATSTLLIEIAGNLPGVGHDLLSVTGSAALGGRLEVTFLDGFEDRIQATDTFVVLTANGGLLNAFSNVASGQRLFTMDGLGWFQVNYGPQSAFPHFGNSVVLSHFVPVPEPSTWALIALGAGVIFVRLFRRKR
jgi:fibronectin-binding autotransporter adhesin